MSWLFWTLLNFCVYNDDCLVYQKFSYISKRINGIYEKDIKIIAGPLLVNCYLPTSCWGQVNLHTPDLRLTLYPPYAFSTWESKKISYLRKIEYAVYVTISPPHHTLMGTYRKLEINVRFQSPSIVKYLGPLMEDLFTASYAGCSLIMSISSH